MTSEVVLTLGWTEIAGSGFAVTVALLALVERLRRTFATRAELKGMRERVIRPLERVTDKLETVGEVQAAHAVALENVLQRLDRIEAAPARGKSRRRPA
jgi:hypothetical protein